MTDKPAAADMAKGLIQLEGVRVHNLRNVSLGIKHGALTVICGVSGSGKSSLAFDTLAAEGQRRYVETFSPYARQFLDRVERPDADRIEGIPPAIAVRQHSRAGSSHSTVGTRTEVMNYMRLLFAQAGCLWCPDCQCPVEESSPQAAAEHLTRDFANRRAMIVFAATDNDYRVTELLQHGYSRAILDGHTTNVESFQDDQLPDATIVADRVQLAPEQQPRISETLEHLFTNGISSCRVLIAATADDDESASAVTINVDKKSWLSVAVSQRPQCPQCGTEYERPVAEALNFQSPLGACPNCEGRGVISGMTLEKIVPDPRLSLRDGAIEPWTTPAYRHELDELLQLAPDYGLPTDVPFCELTQEQRALIQHGVPERSFGGVDCFHNWLVRHRYKRGVSVFLNRWRTWLPCTTCKGTGLNRTARAVQLDGLNISSIGDIEISDLKDRLQDIFSRLSETQTAALATVTRQLTNRLQFLQDIGLGYLTLNRRMATLSGGESQRVVLTAALGAGTINTLYVLDEPTTGLHPADTQKIIAQVRRLQQQGNTVVVVEHDPEFIRAADDVVEIGPQAGEQGGEVVFHGSPTELSEAETATGHSLRSPATVTGDAVRFRDPEHWLEWSDLNAHNISGLSGKLPLGVVCVVTGVSGSGKSSLIVDTLYPALCRRLGKASDAVPGCSVSDLQATEFPDHVELLGQQPLTSNPRSVPATLIGAFDDIRRAFAETHEARKRNFAPGMFSFNSARGGRCEVCEGRGLVTIEMQFLADIQTTCEACHGRRYRSDVLEIRYRGRNIAEVLEMTAETAFRFFGSERRVQQRLNALRQAGLGYLQIGQPVSTLSGGESQRLRIAALLAGVPLDNSDATAGKRRAASTSRTLFILDEPSTGLHLQDIHQLMTCLRHLTEIGHSVVVIEHDPAVVNAADYIIEMGPGPGREGGRIISSRANSPS